MEWNNENKKKWVNNGDIVDIIFECEEDDKWDKMINITLEKIDNLMLSTLASILLFPVSLGFALLKLQIWVLFYYFAGILSISLLICLIMSMVIYLWKRLKE